MARPKKIVDSPKRSRSPGKTVEARENQLISLAVDLAEKQLTAGTASAQVITHYLKLGSTTERLERQRLQYETQLIQAKTQNLKDQKKTEELYVNALDAMRRYRGDLKNGESDEKHQD